MRQSMSFEKNPLAEHHVDVENANAKFVGDPGPSCDIQGLSFILNVDFWPAKVWFGPLSGQ